MQRETRLATGTLEGGTEVPVSWGRRRAARSRDHHDDVVHIVARDLGEQQAGALEDLTHAQALRVVRQTDRLEQVEVGVAEQQVGGAV